MKFSKYQPRYDWRNDPLPNHKRWETKSGKIVLAVARFNNYRNAATGLLGLVVAYICHFFVSSRVAVVIFLSVTVISEIILWNLEKYYGLVASRKAYTYQINSLAVRVVLFILFGLLVAYVFRDSLQRLL